MELRFYPQVWRDLEDAEVKLRAACKVHLLRLRDRQLNAIRSEKVASGLFELKVSWNKQEFRFLFFYGADQAINLVNFFQKTTRKTPKGEIDLGIAHMKEMQLDQAIGIHGIPH
jgi:phage-related protein